MNSTKAIQPALEHFFRHEHGKLMAVLTKTFGTHNLELAEDVVQDTLIKALEHWKLRGIPENPSAWLFTVARNKALDVLRRNRYQQLFADHITPLLKSEYTSASVLQQLIQENEIEDEQLRMMFVCCHPSSAEEGQVALILKTLCGFSVAEIARAFLTNEETIAKRLFRARAAFREQNISFEIPSGETLHKRLDNVLTAIYLLFNEGYHTSYHPSVIRDDLVEEALRLGNLLRGNSKTNTVELFALLALMCFQAARLYGRIDASGNIVQLKDQDRAQWNHELIEQGRYFLNQASTGNTVSVYHVEAAIAYEHCSAPSYAATNWKKINDLYQLLRVLKPLQLISFQHAIVKAELHGPKAGLEELGKLENLAELARHHFLFTAKGEWLTLLGKREEALEALKKAQQLAGNTLEKEFIQRKIDALDLDQ
jgi:RNA polymerase sigma-70 factor (ECF subfamily)